MWSERKLVKELEISRPKFEDPPSYGSKEEQETLKTLKLTKVGWLEITKDERQDRDVNKNDRNSNLEIIMS